MLNNEDWWLKTYKRDIKMMLLVGIIHGALFGFTICAVLIKLGWIAIR